MTIQTSFFHIKFLITNHIIVLQPDVPIINTLILWRRLRCGVGSLVLTNTNTVNSRTSQPASVHKKNITLLCNRKSSIHLYKCRITSHLSLLLGVHSLLSSIYW